MLNNSSSNNACTLCQIPIVQNPAVGLGGGKSKKGVRTEQGIYALDPADLGYKMEWRLAEWGGRTEVSPLVFFLSRCRAAWTVWHLPHMLRLYYTGAFLHTCLYYAFHLVRALLMEGLHLVYA